MLYFSKIFRRLLKQFVWVVKEVLEITTKNSIHIDKSPTLIPVFRR